MRASAIVIGILAVAGAGASALDRTPALFPALRQATVRASTAKGEHDFRVWIAGDAKSRERGLMYVRDMPADHGMLFVFEFPQEVAFWMKNTYLPLDLVFIDADGEVLNVAADAKPFSLDPIESRGEALAVLEVLAGTARKVGLEAGSTVSLPALQTTAAGLKPASPRLPAAPGTR